MYGDRASTKNISYRTLYEFRAINIVAKDFVHDLYDESGADRVIYDIIVSACMLCCVHIIFEYCVYNLCDYMRTCYEKKDKSSERRFYAPICKLIGSLN